MPDGTVIIIGGYAAPGTTDVIESYNEITDTFTVLGTLQIPRRSHTSTLLPNGKILVRGGFGEEAGNTLEIFDPTTGTSELLGVGMSDANRNSHEAVSLTDGRVLIVGSSISGASETAEIFDPSDNSIRSVGRLETGRHSFGMVRLLDGMILAVGGANSLDSVEIYTPSIP